MLGVSDSAFNVIAASGFTGVEINLELYTPWLWGLLSLIVIIPLVLLSLSSNRIASDHGNSRLVIFPILGIFLAIMAAFLAAALNVGKYSEGMEIISDHYNVSLTDGVGEDIDAYDVLKEENNDTNYYPVTIEYENGATEGYLTNPEGNKWALVVGAETSSDFVEFDDFISEDSEADLEEAESDS